MSMSLYSSFRAAIKKAKTIEELDKIEDNIKYNSGFMDGFSYTLLRKYLRERREEVRKYEN